MDPRSYPQWWLDRAAERRLLLESSVNRIREDRLLLASIDGMLIFGSFARNEIGPDSDLDIIAVHQTTESFAYRGLDLRKRLGQILLVPFDLIVYTPEEFDRFSQTTSFVRQARQEGIWIHAIPST